MCEPITKQHIFIFSHVSPNVRIIRDKCSVHHTTIVLYMRIQIMSAEWKGVKIPPKLWKGKAMGGRDGMFMFEGDPYNFHPQL